ncbi:Pet127-domain-containing protein [Teratosphaeria nubilosa]|uniref:Pet127-domain-containing protein n=1 Tax=Teratosphaeria nubilosa TaxID=161662 RepID=A0A6G1KUK6_9PEZI|nr:Pet127-domain-containing protein [Teratosphaeria nubilosa]
MIRPLLRRPSQTACGYVCRRCRYHLARQARTRHTHAFSTSARRGVNGELEETDQDYFGGFNDLSEEYSSTKSMRKVKVDEAKAAQRRNSDNDSIAAARLQRILSDLNAENLDLNGLDQVNSQASGSHTADDSPAGLDALRAQLAQRLDGEGGVGEGQQADDLEASTTTKSAKRNTAFGRTKTWKHPFHGLDLIGQGKVDRGRKGLLSQIQLHSRRQLLADVGLVEREDFTLVSWLNDDGSVGQVLTPMELIRKRKELRIKLRGTGTSPAVSLEDEAVYGNTAQKNAGTKTAFARAQPRSRHQLHGLPLPGQRRIDDGMSWYNVSSARKRQRKGILAKYGLAELPQRSRSLVWRNNDGTTGMPLTPAEAAAKRVEIQEKFQSRPGVFISAASAEDLLDAVEMNTTEKPDDKPQEALNSSQRKTFDGIMAKLQAGLPNRIAAFNVAKQSTAALDESVDAPGGGVSPGGSDALSTQSEKTRRSVNPFSRHVDATDVYSELVRRLDAKPAKSEKFSSKQHLPEIGSGMLLSRPLQRSYDHSRPRTSSEAFALAARAQEVNARNAAWGGISPATKPTKQVRVDSESLRAMDTISRIIPKAASPGQRKAWGQELAPPTTQIASRTDIDIREMLFEHDKESSARSRADRPNTGLNLGKSPKHTLDGLKAALAQSMDSKKMAVKETKQPKKQVSMFRKLMNGLRDVSSFPNSRDAGNDDALSGHLASGKQAVEKRREEERENQKRAEQERKKPVDNATERLAKLHWPSLAAVMPPASPTSPGLDGNGHLPARDGDAALEASEAIHADGINSERVQAAEADDSSSAGEELMKIRRSLNTSQSFEYNAGHRTATKADKTKATAGDEGKQMTLKEAMQQATRPSKNKSAILRIKEILEHRGMEIAESKDGSELAAPVHETKANVDDIKSMLPAELAISNLNIPQPDVPSLQYGLDRALFNPGVYQLQDPHSRVYNFDPHLQKITPIQDFDFNALKEYKTSSQDKMLSKLAQEHGKKYVGSTSSMTGTLAHFHYLLSNWRELNLDMLSRGFREKTSTFTQINRAPNAIFLRWKNGTYAIDADKEYDRPNVLMMLGKSMEKFLTAPREEYERYTRGANNSITQEEKDEPEAYEYTSMGDFLMRSQLDAYDSRLPGNGTFDLKTRAVVSIRMDVEDFETMLGYELHTLQGKFESYEREYYDMMRSTMLKYMLQVRMGRMDGIFVAYHNIERIFGFQYLPIAEMDRVLHGQIDRCLGDQEFRVSLKMLNEVFEMATQKFPGQSLRFHFESADKPANMMWVFAEPVTEDEADAIQNKSKAKIAEFESAVMGIEKKVDEPPSASGDDSSAAVTSQAERETPTVVHSDPLSAYAAVTAKPASPSRDSDPEPTDAMSGSQADVHFMEELSSNPSDHTKPLFAATIILKNHVNGKACENNRPHNLTESDQWRVEYILKEAQIPALDKWARYDDMKLRRRKVLDKEDASLEEEGGGSAEMGEKIKTKPEKRGDGYLRQLRELAERGREFRSKVDKLEEGKEKVVLGMPGAKGEGDAEGEIVGSGVDSAVEVAGEDGEVRDVEIYMRWLFSAKDGKGRG